MTPRQFLLFAALSAATERFGSITHAIGAVDAWHLLRCVGRRPLLFTVAIDGEPLALEFYDRVSHFVAETDSLAQRLRAAGVGADRISVLPPGVPLGRFAVTPLPAGPPWRLLFASTPSDPAEIRERGIPLLIDLARDRRDIEVRLLWRTWGDVGRAQEALAALSPPSNVVVQFRDVPDMSQEYSAAHIVVCPFTKGFGKAAPNSIIEGLASGRPALVSDACGLAREIEEAGAGAVFALEPNGIAVGLEALLSRLTDSARAARQLAECRFDEITWLRKYEAWYTHLGNRKSTT